MRVALSQINPVLGDFAENRKKMVAECHRAKAENCDLVVFPEASLFGYHPVDLLERPSIVKVQLKELKKLHSEIPKDVAVLTGAITLNPKKDGKPYFNAAVLLQKGKKPRVFAKELLPTYDVFDEGRHIQPGCLRKNTFRLKQQKILVTICEDIWAWPLNSGRGSNYEKNPIKEINPKDVDLVINLSASPFTDKKLKARYLVTKKTSAHLKAPLVYVNMVGAQDEIIFDGASFVMEKDGKVSTQLPRFVEGFAVYDLKSPSRKLSKISKNVDEARYEAVVLGIKDFVSKVGMDRVHLGSSGGIDSAAVACLAAKALGSKQVTTIAMPGPYSSKESLELAKQLAKNLGVEFLEVPIAHGYEQFLKDIEGPLNLGEFSVVQENLQARLRMLALMAFSNAHSSMLLNTSNKSEMATGYTTLYGDMAGGLSPIGDLMKTEVYSLARFINRHEEIIPERIIDRPPSAELRPNQTDQDTLPPYDELDPAVERMVENYRSPKSDLDWLILRMMMKSEFKRWQAPPVLKVSEHAFGRGRRLPVAHRAIY